MCDAVLQKLFNTMSNNALGIYKVTLSFVTINPFMPDGICRPYQFDESAISNLKVCWIVIYNFIQILKVHAVSKQYKTRPDTAYCGR